MNCKTNILLDNIINNAMEIVNMYPLPVCFKGNRNYVSSTDVFVSLNTVLKRVFGDKCWLKGLYFNEMTNKKIYVSFDDNDRENPLLIGRLLVNCGGEVHNGFILKSLDEIDCRYSSDDMIFEKISLIEDSEIIQTKSSNKNNIEEVVGLTKLLHQSSFPDKNAMWVYAGLDLKIDIMNQSNQLFTIKIEKKLGESLTVSSVKMADNYVGKIKFIKYKI